MLFISSGVGLHKVNAVEITTADFLGGLSFMLAMLFLRWLLGSKPKENKDEKGN